MNINYTQNVVKRLQSLRLENGMTQNDLAKKIGVSRSCIANWERNLREPDSVDLCKIACFFNASTEYLCGRTDRRTTIKIPKIYNIDFSKLNSAGKKAMFAYYEFLLTDENFTQKDLT